MAEADVRGYGVSLHDGLSLRQKAAALERDWSIRRADPASLSASDMLVDTGLVEKYRRAREWEGRPVDVVPADGERVVIDGHHRLVAAVAEGVGEVPVRLYDPPASL